MALTVTKNLSYCSRLAAVMLSSLVAACSEPVETPEAEPESWSVTAWGERFEIFPEVDALVVGQTAVAHTHVTVLDGFLPLTEGLVEIVLSEQDGEQVFASDQAVRPGIFSVEIRPERAGDFDVSFRIRDLKGTEQIRGGRVRIGATAADARLLRAPAPRAGSDGGAPQSFLKEEQWRGDFGTEWVRERAFASSVRAVATLGPPAGGQTTITAPMNGVILSGTGGDWPFPGRKVQAGQLVFRVLPLVTPERSLSTLESEVSALTAEFDLARGREDRLENLLTLDAVSLREVEAARTLTRTLEIKRQAASVNLEAAKAARTGSRTTSGVRLEAPFTGSILEVLATPGTTVSAGDALARVVRTDSIWLQLAIAPSDARRLQEDGVQGVVIEGLGGDPVRLEEGLRLVAIAPELSLRTGKVIVLIEAPAVPGLSLGTTASARVLLQRSQEGIVVASSAIIDDGGVSVAYLQLSGESFARQEVDVVERQGDLVLIEGLLPGHRLVTTGGESIRRASLMSSGEAQGHVH